MSKVDYARALRGLENQMQSMWEPNEDHHKTLLNAAIEIDRLRAELAERDEQEPVGEVAKEPHKRWVSVDRHGYSAEIKAGDKLYTRPPAAVPEGLPKRVRENIAMLLDEAAVEERSNDPEAGMPADDETADGMTYLAARLRGDGEES